MCLHVSFFCIHTKEGYVQSVQPGIFCWHWRAKISTSCATSEPLKMHTHSHYAGPTLHLHMQTQIDRVKGMGGLLMTLMDFASGPSSVLPLVTKPYGWISDPSDVRGFAINVRGAIFSIHNIILFYFLSCLSFVTNSMWFFCQFCLEQLTEC